MEFSDYLGIILRGMLAMVVPLTFWTVALIFYLAKNKGKKSRAGILLVVGICIMILKNILFVPSNNLTLLFFPHHENLDTIRMWSSVSKIVLEIIGAFGIGLLLYAFWLEVTGKKTEKRLPENGINGIIE